MLKRNEVALKDTWNLSDMFATDEVWEAEFSKVSKELDFSKYKGKLSDKKTLLQCLREIDVVQEKLTDLAVYASNKYNENTKETKYQGFDGRISSLFTEFATNVSFIEPELCELDDEVIKKWINDKDFSDYDYMLSEMLRTKPHTLSEKEERILSLSSDAVGQYDMIFSMLNNADLKFGEIKNDKGETVTLSHGTYALLLRSLDADTRRRAFEQYYSVFKGFQNTLAASLTGNMKTHQFYAKARGYNSCLERSLANENVDISVYNNLLTAVNNATPIMHEYMALRKRVLGFKEYHMYDMFIPIVKDVDIVLEYEQATELVKEALKPLGEEYQQLLERSFNERWIDVYETEGKRSGAYCSPGNKKHPFVLLNYQKTTDDIFTLAHELGHAMHSYYSTKTQPYAKHRYKIFVAEVASTVNEVLLLKHLLKKYDDVETRKFLLTHYLDMIRTTLFRQTQFAQFEYIAHKMVEDNQPVTHQALSEKYYELNKKFYGDAVFHDEQIAFEWSRVPHFYYNFYVYKYSTGITAAITLAENILSDTSGKALERYINFLKSGGSKSPVDILADAGVDLRKVEAFDVAMKSFAKTVKELDELTR